jgi:hypothetical protein
MSNQTYKSADSALGRMIGDNRSDQQMENDRRQTAALERGDDTFEKVEGGRGSVRGYRDLVAPTRGSVMANLNERPSVGTILGGAASLLTPGPFPVGTLVGQGVKYGVNRFFGGN